MKRIIHTFIVFLLLATIYVCAQNVVLVDDTQKLAYEIDSDTHSFNLYKIDYETDSSLVCSFFRDGEIKKFSRDSLDFKTDFFPKFNIGFSTLKKGVVPEGMTYVTLINTWGYDEFDKVENLVFSNKDRTRQFKFRPEYKALKQNVIVPFEPAFLDIYVKDLGSLNIKLDRIQKSLFVFSDEYIGKYPTEVGIATRYPIWLYTLLRHDYLLIEFTNDRIYNSGLYRSEDGVRYVQKLPKSKCYIRDIKDTLLRVDNRKLFIWR